MHSWISKPYRPAVTALLIKRGGFRPAAVLLAVLLCQPLAAETNHPIAQSPDRQIEQTNQQPTTALPSTSGDTATPTLQAFKANYQGKLNGISAELSQQLQQKDNIWRFESKASAMFVNFEENAEFIQINGSVTPQSYRYSNPVSSNKNSDLTFDWKTHRATDTIHAKKGFDIPATALDKLSFQCQLRLDLMQQGDSFNGKTYHLVDRKNTKTYNVTRLGDEALSIPAGVFDTIKLKQQRAGKEDYSLIWLAKDKEYFIVQMQRIEDGKVEYEVQLSRLSHPS